MFTENFAKRLKDLMEIEGMSIRALSLKIGVDRRSVRLWLKAKFLPRYDALVKLSVYFDVNVDYLLGLEDGLTKSGGNKKNIEEIDMNRIQSEFSKKFAAIMEERQLTRYAVSKNLKVDAKSVAKWLTGSSMPETINLIKLAKIADMSVDALLGQE